MTSRAARPAADGEAAQALRSRVRERARALEALYRHIASTRMEGVPILHTSVGVAAVGFEADADGRGASGVLVTPWFMNLVWLPLAECRPAKTGPARDAGTPAPGPLALGATRDRAVGNTRFPFIGAGEEPFGPFEACSLFSPMFEFEDHAAALATARAVLDHLRQPPVATAGPASPQPPASMVSSAPPTEKPLAARTDLADDAAVDTRRRWLFGAGHTASAAAVR